MTRRVMGEAFPDDTIFIDYEALTAALPAEYAALSPKHSPSVLAPSWSGRRC